MITLIIAPPKTGKGALMCYFFQQEAFNRERISKGNKAIENANEKGFHIPKFEHFAFSSVRMEAHCSGYKPRINYAIDPFTIGLSNSKFKTTFVPEYSVIFIPEGQIYFNSRKRLNEFTSAWFQNSGHHHLDLYIDGQRITLFDANVRELATRCFFVETIKNKTDRHGNLQKVLIYCTQFDDCNSLENYVSSGKKENNGKSICFEAPAEIYEYYNAYENSRLFYNGYENKKLEFRYGAPEVNYSAPRGWYEKE